MIVTCVKTRMTHAAVRHLLPQSPYWPSQNGTEADPDQPGRHHGHLAQPRHLRLAPDEQVGPAHPLGRARRLPAPVADHRAHVGRQGRVHPGDVGRGRCTGQAGPRPVIAATPEGIKLADVLLDIAQISQIDLNGDGVTPVRPVMHALTRYMLGDVITDSLQIPRALGRPRRMGVPRFVDIREGAALPADPDALLDLRRDPPLQRDLLPGWFAERVHRDADGEPHQLLIRRRAPGDHNRDGPCSRNRSRRAHPPGRPPRPPVPRATYRSSVRPPDARRAGHPRPGRPGRRSAGHGRRHRAGRLEVVAAAERGSTRCSPGSTRICLRCPAWIAPGARAGRPQRQRDRARRASTRARLVDAAAGPGAPPRWRDVAAERTRHRRPALAGRRPPPAWW